MNTFRIKTLFITGRVRSDRAYHPAFPTAKILHNKYAVNQQAIPVYPIEITWCSVLFFVLFFPSKEQREREKQDLELAKEMAEEDDDFP